MLLPLKVHKAQPADWLRDRLKAKHLKLVSSANEDMVLSLDTVWLLFIKLIKKRQGPRLFLGALLTDTRAETGILQNSGSLF